MISNARDAIIYAAPDRDDSCPRTITIRTFHQNDEVVATVSDTGPGIPAAIQDRIFEPFLTTKEVGMGLSIIYHFVEDIDGKIEVSSHPDTGTTFTLSFPAAEEPVQ